MKNSPYLSCIIIDDEPLARKGLREYIDAIDFLEFEAEYDNALKALPAISTEKTQLLLMDIEMPKISGIEFFKTLNQAPPVVFITAYPNYALDGFEVNALDYLVKPVSFERFYKAALKAKEFYELRQLNKENASAETKDYFFIKADGILVKINFNDILYAEALQNYVNIVTRQKKYICYLTFKSIEEYLPSNTFIKTHKSFMVAADKIDSIDGNDIRIGNVHIPISRNLKDEVIDKIVKGKFLKR